MRKIIAEFKEFAIKGNMLDMAIGVIIGAAFKSIVDSLVNDIFMPFVGILIGGRDFSGLSIKIGEATINYGMLIQNIVNFLIVAVCLFMLVKTVNMLKRKKEEVEPEPEKKPEDIQLLEEIRDVLSVIRDK
jgi:large conductance mechanosensitive channel